MKRLILAGGGHAHLHVLKLLEKASWPGVEVVLVSPHDRQVYSGMLPGWIAGHYRLDECVAPLRPLAEAAGVHFVQDSMVAMDAERRTIRCAGAGDMVYDVLSLDIGAQVDVSSLAATGAALLPIRPLERFIIDWTHQLTAFQQIGRARVAVVGGGAAGVELALALRHRLVTLLGPAQAQVILVSGTTLLPGHGKQTIDRVIRAMRSHGVQHQSDPAGSMDAGLRLADRRELRVDCVIAATGVSPPEWLSESQLALAEDGFIAVAEGQQSVSHADVFAVGDIASRVDHPHPKSGVYAVRAGPVLGRNLRCFLENRPILAYRPQRRSLYLLATGPKHAILSWGPWSAEGAWVWRWKNWIDRRFLKEYKIIGSATENSSPRAS